MDEDNDEDCFCDKCPAFGPVIEVGRYLLCPECAEKED